MFAYYWYCNFYFIIWFGRDLLSSVLPYSDYFIFLLYLNFFIYLLNLIGHAVAQLVEALRHKPEGHGFDF